MSRKIGKLCRKKQSKSSNYFAAQKLLSVKNLKLQKKISRTRSITFLSLNFLMIKSVYN